MYQLARSFKISNNLAPCSIGTEWIALPCDDGLYLWQHTTENPGRFVPFGRNDIMGYGISSDGTCVHFCTGGGTIYSRAIQISDSIECNDEIDEVLNVKCTECVAYFYRHGIDYCLMKRKDLFVFLRLSSSKEENILETSDCPEKVVLGFKDGELAFTSKQGTFLFYQNSNKEVFSVDLKRSRLSTSPVTCFCIHPNSPLIALGTYGGEIVLLSVTKDGHWDSCGKLRWHRSSIEGVSFSIAGTYLYTFAAEPTLLRWRLMDTSNRVSAIEVRKRIKSHLIQVKPGTEVDVVPRLPSRLLSLTIIPDNGDAVFVTEGNVVGKVSIRMSLKHFAPIPQIPTRRPLQFQFIDRKVYATGVPELSTIQILSVVKSCLQKVDTILTEPSYIDLSVHKPHHVVVDTRFCVDNSQRLLVWYQCWQRSSIELKFFDLKSLKCVKTFRYPRKEEKITAMNVLSTRKADGFVLWIGYDSGAIETWSLDLDTLIFEVDEVRRSGLGDGHVVHFSFGPSPTTLMALSTNQIMCLNGSSNNLLSISADCGEIKAISVVSATKALVIRSYVAELFHIPSQTVLFSHPLDSVQSVASNGNTAGIVGNDGRVSVLRSETDKFIETQIANIGDKDQCHVCINDNNDVCLFDEHNGFRLIGHAEGWEHENGFYVPDKTRNQLVYERIEEMDDAYYGDQEVRPFVVPKTRQWPSVYLIPNLNQLCMDIMSDLLTN
ncbi:hypothetical protein ACOME3_003175 [Neoechinorhynchus agilis]